MKNNYFKKAVAALGVAALTVAFSSQANAQSGLALSLSGSGQYMSVPDHNNFDIAANSSITITMWLKTPLTGGLNNGRTFSKMSASTAGYEGFVGTNGANIAGNVRTTQTPGTNIGITAYPSPSPGLNTNTWRHIAFVITSDGVNKAMQLYVDGNPYGSNTGKATSGNDISNAQPLLFGAKSDLSPSNFFKGEMDEIHVWSKALTQIEVQTDMVTPVTGSTPNVIAAWNFEGTSGSNVPDVTGNGHDGTLMGNPVLPLNITDFSALVKSNSINYAWTTANEKGVSHFEPEYSTDGTNFTKAGEITAKGNGSYTFAYAYGATAGQVYVRVKAVDLDGSSTTSKVIALSISNTASFTISPNPVADVITIDNPVEGASANLSITNTQGQTVISTTFTGSKAQINVSALAKGVYIAKLSVAGTTQVLKFIKK